MILDHIHSLGLPDDHAFPNEVAVLRSLKVGLGFLNAQLTAIEKETWAGGMAALFAAMRSRRTRQVRAWRQTPPPRHQGRGS